MYGIFGDGSGQALATGSIDDLLRWAGANLKPNGAVLRIKNVQTGATALVGKAGSGWSRNADAVHGGAPYEYRW